MTGSAVRRRPRDRKAQIAATAADLFRRQGYDGTAMGDIAAAVGITAPALYRHYAGKKAILADAVLPGVDQLIGTLDASLAAPSEPAERLRGLLDSLAGLAVEQRDLSVLWQREGHQLDHADREGRSAGLGAAIRRWTGLLRELRPGLREEDGDLLCWSALSVYGSISMHHVAPARGRLERLLPELAGAALRFEPPPELRVEVHRPPTLPDGRRLAVAVDLAGWPHQPGSRREELLTSAIGLFRERGYHAVSMEEIAGAAGIAAPSVYRHFDGKADILGAALDRVALRLERSVAEAVEPGLPPAQTLDLLVGSYAEIAVRHRDGIALYLSESRTLPDRKGSELRRLQRAYFGEWARLLAEVRPGLTDPDARIAVHAAVSVVVDAIRTPRFVRRPHLADDLRGLAGAVLLSPAHPGS